MRDGLCLATLQTENDKCLILIVSSACFLSLTRAVLNGRPISLSTGREVMLLTNKIINSKTITNEMLGLCSNEDDICRVLKRLGDKLDCRWISYVCFVNKILLTIGYKNTTLFGNTTC